MTMRAKSFGSSAQRPQMRQFMRLTNVFSKTLEDHIHMVARYPVWYNFVKMHKRHRKMPAVAPGVSGRLGSMEDVAEVVEMVEATAPKPGERCPYKKRVE